MHLGGSVIDVAMAHQVRVGDGGGKAVADAAGSERDGIAESIEGPCRAAEFKKTLVAIVQCGKVHRGTESGGTVVGSAHAALNVQLLHLGTEVWQIDEPGSL